MAGAVAGIVAGQYARLTSLVLSGQISQISSVMFRPQDMLLDAALGGIFAGVGYGIGRAFQSASAMRGATCSFSENTEVATKEGEKPISEIKIGDLVLAYNEVTEENGYYPVTDVLSHQDPFIVELTIDGETITTTPEHPFYTFELGWQTAGEVTVGSKIRQSDGIYGEVTAIEVINQPQQMFNLTVDKVHTFYVGDQEWLVHNSCNFLNKNNVPYPDVDVPGYGKVPFPDAPYEPNNTATRSNEFTKPFKDQFKNWWIQQGYPWPVGKVNIHHIKPLQFGGQNTFDNLVPLSIDQQSLFTNWWRNFR